MKTLYTLITLISLTPVILVADTIYKSTDDTGHVTYSTTPSDSADKTKSVDITPPPSDERIKAAQDRHDRNKEAAGIMDENRQKRDEITAAENRKKRENQKQQQLQKKAENNNRNDDYSYPYIPGRRPIGVRPPIRRPIQLPSH